MHALLNPFRFVCRFVRSLFEVGRLRRTHRVLLTSRGRSPHRHNAMASLSRVEASANNLLSGIVAKFDILGEGSGTILSAGGQRATQSEPPTPAGHHTNGLAPAADAPRKSTGYRPNKKQQLKHAMTVQSAHMITTDYVALSQPLVDGVLSTMRMEAEINPLARRASTDAATRPSTATSSSVRASTRRYWRARSSSPSQPTRPISTMSSVSSRSMAARATCLTTCQTRRCGWPLTRPSRRARSSCSPREVVRSRMATPARRRRRPLAPPRAAATASMRPRRRRINTVARGRGDAAYHLSGRAPRRDGGVV